MGNKFISKIFYQEPIMVKVDNTSSTREYGSRASHVAQGEDFPTRRQQTHLGLDHGVA